MKKKLCLIFLAVILLHKAYGMEPLITIYAKKIAKTSIALAYFKNEEESDEGLGKNLRMILEDDLSFTNYFIWIPPGAFLEDPSQISSPNYTLWKNLQCRFLITGIFKREEKEVSVTLDLHDIYKAQVVTSKTKRAPLTQQRWLMHSLANDIIETLTGEKGIFLTKILFVSTYAGHKELFIMDYDGQNPTQLTKRKNIVLLPSWSPDGKKILFSSYNIHQKNRKNLDLFVMDVETKDTKVLSDRIGLNMGGIFSSNGESIALTLLTPNKGLPSLYLMDAEGNNPKLIAQSFENDFSSTFSPDGKKLLFVSTRAGNPHLFIKDLEAPATEAKRLTYAGKYNAKPDWSKASNMIAFAGQLEGHFDLFTIDPNGFVIERLTKIESRGDNEHPSWAPNGKHLAFSSTKEGLPNIYAITSNGSYEKKLTKSFGECTTPAWSPVNFDLEKPSSFFEPLFQLFSDLKKSVTSVTLK